VDKAACFSRTPQFVKLCAVKPPFRIALLPTPHAGSCSCGSLLRLLTTLGHRNGRRRRSRFDLNQ
jgi:hypothetical protein